MFSLFHTGAENDVCFQVDQGHKINKKIKFYALKKYDITIEKRKQSAIITLVYKEKW